MKSLNFCSIQRAYDFEDYFKVSPPVFENFKEQKNEKQKNENVLNCGVVKEHFEHCEECSRKQKLKTSYLYIYDIIECILLFTILYILVSKK
jgi:hypothetical protein